MKHKKNISLTPALEGNKQAIKDCESCRYEYRSLVDVPCCYCDKDYSKWKQFV